MLDSLQGNLQTLISERDLRLITVTKNQPNEDSINQGNENQFGKQIKSTFLLNDLQQAKGNDTEMLSSKDRLHRPMGSSFME